MNGPGLRKATYVGLFFVTLATLMYEILLPRIFSVTRCLFAVSQTSGDLYSSGKHSC